MKPDERLMCMYIPLDNVHLHAYASSPWRPPHSDDETKELEAEYNRLSKEKCKRDLKRQIEELRKELGDG